MSADTPHPGVKIQPAVPIAEPEAADRRRHSRPVRHFELEFRVTGPQKGARIHRLPRESSQVDMRPQLPASWKSTSSLQKSSLL